jgi:hypothetical protein
MENSISVGLDPRHVSKSLCAQKTQHVGLCGEYQAIGGALLEDERLFMDSS